MTKITCDTIIGYLQDKIENKEPVAPDVWLDACLKLSVLVGDEQADLYQKQQDVALLKVTFIEQGDSVAMAKVKVEAKEAHKMMKMQEAKVERIFETIRIAKIQSRMANSEIRGYN